MMNGNKIDHHFFRRKTMWATLRFYRTSLAYITGPCGRTFCSNSSSQKYSNKIATGPGLDHFIGSTIGQTTTTIPTIHVNSRQPIVPYLPPELIDGKNQKVYIEVYGCQMNVNDTEIIRTILKSHNYQFVNNVDDANVILLVTCAIREGAESKIWARLRKLKMYKRQLGLLGCMAERLKEKAIQKEKLIDIIAGPDSYRSLPTLLAANRLSGQSAVNVLLSLEETYKDVQPDPICAGKASTFVSIMRGCDNMCSYCIVPFTRGRERSRPIESIVDEVKIAVTNGIREVTLLGQNVNSYRDTSSCSFSNIEGQKLVSGFKTIYKPKEGGLTFDRLLDEVAKVNPEVRIRFTSPHPKDFPDEVLDTIMRHKNICKCIHLPAQSGSNTVLERMRRGYTREAYLQLVEKIKSKIPSVALTSDFISGFCGETEEEHLDTVDLMEKVGYSFCYLFAYSMREKTHAYYKLKDDVPFEVKTRRVDQLNQLFRSIAQSYNNSLIGSNQLVLVEGPSLRSQQDLKGRCDRNTRVVFPAIEVVNEETGQSKVPSIGDYVVINIQSATSQSLKGTPITFSSIDKFEK